MITICCPSRSRPEFAFRLCQNIAKTAQSKVEVLFHIDNDDLTLSDYKRLCPEARFVRGDRHLLGTLYNRLWRESKGDILMLTGDDIYFTTQGWDKEVEKAFGAYPDKICFVSGGRPLNFIGPTYLFVSRKVCDILGYFTPPFLNRWIDIWLWDIARAIDRMVEVNMYADHIHPSTGKREPDQVIRELDVTLENDRAMYQIGHHARKFDIATLKKRIVKDILFY